MEGRPWSRIAEVFRIWLLIAIVVMETEVGTASLLAGFVALPFCFVNRTWTACDDASGCLLLPREVRDRLARMIVRVGNVDEMVRRVNRDLEKVGKAAVGAAKEAAGRDLPRVIDMVGSFAERENGRDSVAVDALRNEHVPLCGQWNRVRIASLISTIPRDSHVAVGIGRDPGKQVRLSSLGRVLSYLDGRRPARPVSFRVRVIDVGVVRPRGVHEAEVVYRERGEQIAEAEPTRTVRTGRTAPATADLVLSERDRGTIEIH